MRFEQAIHYVEREFLILREELVAGKTDRWSILCSAMTRHWNHCIENIALIEMQRPKATRVETEADWAERLAQRWDIELLYDRLDIPGGLSLGGTIVADSRLEGPERAVQLLSLLAREVLTDLHRSSTPGDVPELGALEVDLVTHTTATTAGLTSAPPQPRVPRLDDCGIVELVEMFRRVRHASSTILEGLHQGFCEDLPV